MVGKGGLWPSMRHQQADISCDQPTASGLELDIIVVGAGLGGLAAAVAASLSGHRVTVIEAAPELREVRCSPNVSFRHTRTLTGLRKIELLLTCF